MKKRNPPNPAKGCASELYDLQSNRREKGGVVRAGEKVRLNHEKKYFCFSNRLFLSNRGYAKKVGFKRLDNSFFPYEKNCCK